MRIFLFIAPLAAFAAAAVGCGAKDAAPQHTQDAAPRHVQTAAEAAVAIDAVRLAAGYAHACLLDSDGTISCEEHDGSAYPAPVGHFLQISAAGSSTCGIRTNFSAACWSRAGTWSVNLLPPDGQFRFVAAGGRRACGLRPNGQIECWGEITPGPGSTPPDGQFRSLSLNVDHACAIANDGAVACWGVGGDRYCEDSSSSDRDFCWGGDGGEKAQPPSERLQTLSAGVHHTCGIREDATVLCWGDERRTWATPAPDVRFKSVSAGDEISCGITQEDELVCWGEVYGTPLGEPAGTYVATAIGTHISCALRADGATDCWRDLQFQKAYYPGPEGRFRSVSAGWAKACGVALDGSLSCWGTDPYRRGWPAEPPGGVYRAVVVGAREACAFRVDGDAVCWNSSTGKPVAVFSVNIRHVSFRFPGPPGACAVGMTGRLYCSNSVGRNAETAAPPDGQFSEVAVGNHHACALQTNGQIRCWGEDNFGLASPPEGSYRSISAGDNHACALSTSGNVTCWGSSGWGPGSSPKISGPARKIDAGGYVTCAIRPDYRVACSGHRARELSPPRDERYKAISVGLFIACGIRLNDTVACRHAPPVEE